MLIAVPSSHGGLETVLARHPVCGDHSESDAVGISQAILPAPGASAGDSMQGTGHSGLFQRGFQVQCPLCCAQMHNIQSSFQERQEFRHQDSLVPEQSAV